MIAQNKRLAGILLAVAGLLALPLIALQFTTEVSWTRSDFVAAGILLLGTGLLDELVLRKVRQTRHRLLFVAGLLLALVLVWAELAVGVFGTPFAGS